MLSVCSFSEQAIIDFCEVTLDHNVVHDPAYMKSQSKKSGCARNVDIVESDWFG